jgi:GT2 family glycosyltransferase
VINKLGNYREELEFYCEELDYSLRAFKVGYKVVSKSDLVVHHRIDWKTRNLQFNSDLSKGIYGSVYRSSLGFCNSLIIVKLHFPFPFNYLFFLYYILIRFKQYYIQLDDRAGFWGGLKRFRTIQPMMKKYTQPLSFKMLYRWLKMKSW